MQRIVTGHDADGRPEIQIDGAPVTVMDFGSIETTEIWVTDATPPDLNGSEDTSVTRPWALDPPRHGTAFRVVTFLPEGQGRATEPEAVAEEPEFLDEHGTRTLDYVCVLSGEIVLTVGTREVVLKPGDCVVQRGTSHTWTNRGTVPCVVVGVLVSALD
jgi:mannose-6-phosphate isomerase-like protein (cupin superfamily)